MSYGVIRLLPRVPASAKALSLITFFTSCHAYGISIYSSYIESLV